VTPPGSQVGGQRIELALVGVVDKRAEEAENDEEDEDRGAYHGDAVRRELTQGQSPTAGDDLNLTPLGPTGEDLDLWRPGQGGTRLSDRMYRFRQGAPSGRRP